ncbi:MBL fold metallo-hydrolase RNA specificity domain-containing protein [Pseudomonas sp. MAC6]|uniref:MBL fold metallo-hydrolase RNA specificity domain-containing protein n=1 Tax=Pseudomonas sp. MAC6 TaxID=3401633 RepID=UPI003BF582E1
MLGDDRPGVLFVGYQAKGAAGRQILRFARKGGYVEMDEKCYAIRAQVHTIDGYSAHSDQKGLFRLVTGMRPMAVTSVDCTRGVP